MPSTITQSIIIKTITAGCPEEFDKEIKEFYEEHWRFPIRRKRRSLGLNNPAMVISEHIG